MANLDLIQKLNNHYGKRNPIAIETKFHSLNESFDPGNIEKAISDSIYSLGPLFTAYFDFGLPADVVLLYIDVCGFSTKFSNLEGEEIGEYFDTYYDIVIPIIYDYGGEVDKIMGDGIICIFGPPFQDIGIEENICKAEKCAKDIIKATKGTKFASKIAMHNGTINYFKNKTGLYNEFTIIGKPLTELFRLESISLDECVNYYGETEIRDHFQDLISRFSRLPQEPAVWIHCHNSISNLKGVSYDHFFSIELNQLLWLK